MGSETDRLIIENQRLVHYVAGLFSVPGLDREDVAGYGFLGLIKAARAFKPGRGVKFGTYAFHAIENEIIHAIYDYSRTIRVPPSAYRKYREAKRLKREGLAVSRRQLLTVFRVSKAATPQRLHVSGNSNDPLSCDANDFPSAESDPLVIAVEKEEVEARARRVAAALRFLNERERIVLIRRYGLDGRGEKTLREISRTVGVGREQVRQYLIRAEGKIKREICRMNLAGGCG